MRAFALLLLLAASICLATAHECPSSLHHADSGDRRQLADVGLAAFRTHISSFCRRMPVYVTEPGHFDASVTAKCTNSDLSTSQFKVEFKSPCDGNALTTVYMTVDTKPNNCDKEYVPKLAKWGWYTKVPGNMRPLECPAGFRKANKRNMPLLQAFVNEEFLQKSMPELKAKEGRHPRFYCKAGIKSISYRYLNGCVQIWPRSVAPYVMSQGKVAYTCYNSNNVRNLGLDGEGLYKTKCREQVDFDNNA